MKHLLFSGIFLCLFGNITSSAALLIDFESDVANLPSGFSTGWFSGGLFNNAVAGGWDAGDYSWQMGQVNQSSTTDFTSAGFNFSDFGNTAGAWDSTANNLLFTRASSPVEATTANSALTVFALTLDVLAQAETVTLTSNFGASGGGDLGYQLYLNDTALQSRSVVDASAQVRVSSSFTLSQGDSLYIALDANGSEASDRRGYTFTVSSIPEPSSLLLLGLAGFGVMLWKRRIR